MRTYIDIDDNLMKEALKASQLKTKKDAIEEGLRLLIRHNKKEKIKNLKGKLQWRGDLDQMRTDDNSVGVNNEPVFPLR